MARPEKETPRASRLVPALLVFAREKGLDHALIAVRLGIEEGAIDREECAATTTMIEDLLEEISEGLGEPAIALRLPRDLTKKRYDLAELAARSSPDARSALGRIAKYMSTVHPSLDGAFEESPAGRSDGRLVVRAPSHPRGVGRHACEYALAYALTHLRAACTDSIAATRVWFSHARPSDLAPLHLFFGTSDLTFGAADSGFSIAHDLLEKKGVAHDPRMLATIEELAEHALAKLPRDPQITTLLGAKLLALLPNDANIDAASRALHLSARTLQRRLEASGASFSDVLDSVRKDEALRLLEDDAISLGEITHRLGFSDLATFSRAFKRWTGKPPGTFRTLAKSRG